MTIPRRIAVAVAVCLLCSGVTAAQTIDVRVRLVYLEDGKPAKGQKVILDLGGPGHMSGADWLSGKKSPEETTSSDGVAVFHVPKPPPRTVFVEFGSGDIRGCATGKPALFKKVIGHGVTVGVDERYGPSCKGDRELIKRLAAQPGEIVIFVRKLSIWDKLLEY